MTRTTELHEKALIAARRYKIAEIDLIEALQLVGEQRVFYHYKYNSLFQYAVGALGLSEEVAYIFINVSRKASEVPALKQEIRDGKISVSKAKVIAPVLNQENQKHWLDIARTRSKRQIEREVALASPRNAVREQVTYVSEPLPENTRVLHLREVYVELKIGVPEPLMLKLRHAQDLVSQAAQTHVTLVKTLEAVLDFYLQRKDPLVKAKRQKMRGKLDAEVKKPVPGPVNVGAASSRSKFPAATKHKIFLKYEAQCAFVEGDGQRCPQRRLLEIHHIKPVHLGGTNEPENLTLLCQGHHRAFHISESETTM